MRQFRWGGQRDTSWPRPQADSGKSLLQVMLAQADIEDTGNKQLILVPKNHIHHGFFDDDCIEFVLPGQSEPSKWVVARHFCATSKAVVKTRRLKEFLLADVRELRTLGELATIATHKAMVAAWSSMRAAERKRALQHLSSSHIYQKATRERCSRSTKLPMPSPMVATGRSGRHVWKRRRSRLSNWAE